MMEVQGYKLTDKHGYTRHRTLWGPGVTHTAPGGRPCTAGVVHWYENKLIAVLTDPIHGMYNTYGTAQLWICRGVQTGTDGLKCWGTSCTTIQEIPKPVITIPQRVRWAIYVAQELHQPHRWNDWAEAWLSGADRSQAAARAVDAATIEATAAVDAAVWSAEATAADTARSVAAAEAAMRAADAAVWSMAVRAGKTHVTAELLVELAEQAIHDEGDNA